MQSCPACGTRVSPAQKFCSQCGSRLMKVVEAGTTVESTRRVPAFSTNIDEGRFPPGLILAQRYRIVSLLGRGGMGEVYRANDLLLGQPVALKFLLPAATASESALSRFCSEVRTVLHKKSMRIWKGAISKHLAEVN